MNPRWTLRRWVKRLRIWYLLWRDGSYCAYCDCKMPRIGGPHDSTRNWIEPQIWARRRTLDHVVPRSRGGTNRLSNLVLSCATCNQRKGSRSEAAFRADPVLQRRRATIQAEADHAGRE